MLTEPVKDVPLSLPLHNPDQLHISSLVKLITTNITTAIHSKIKDDTLPPTENKREAIRFGILGCTRTASTITRAINSLHGNKARVVAVGSQTHNRAVQFISANGLPNSTIALGSYDAVLDLNLVDAVFVSLIRPTHSSWAIAAARKGKHVLLETPTALSTEELEFVLQACIDNRVQFMDSTMWLHDRKTIEMQRFIRDNNLFGDLSMVHSICTSQEDTDMLLNGRFHELGVLSHAGWYCISLILWANSYELPYKVVALYATKNASGILLSFGAMLFWPHGSATLHCSYSAHLTRRMRMIGTKGTLEISVEPYGEGTASFQRVSDANFTHLRRRHDTTVTTVRTGRFNRPKDVRMLRKFVRLVRSIKEQGREPKMIWHDISKKTQMIVDLVMESIHNDLDEL